MSYIGRRSSVRFLSSGSSLLPAREVGEDRAQKEADEVRRRAEADALVEEQIQKDLAARTRARSTTTILFALLGVLALGYAPSS
ncbi:hypothetical protein VM1G_12056 [Cytospora mali]|uniref:Uncharacterized protein n=1 Tax=Cytospora mali TaxID=578113 RepID=A0A194VJ64_CYTMA|nr:hypothetical protein VM1G_12056 [Valsa mali]